MNIDTDRLQKYIVVTTPYRLLCFVFFSGQEIAQRIPLRRWKKVRECVFVCVCGGGGGGSTTSLY